MKPALTLLMFVLTSGTSFAQDKDFKVLGYVREGGSFLFGARMFFSELADKNNFTFDVTGTKLTDSILSNYQVVMFLGPGPSRKSERKAFERFMENGGGWIGFHEVLQFKKDRSWPWFHNFLGTTRYIHSEPALPARLVIDDSNHPVTQNVPRYITTPRDEWLQWEPDPRLNKNIKVLASLDTSNYPIGITSILKGGDTPIAWTNTNYKMVYFGIGYDHEAFWDRLQNQLVKDALLWVGKKSVPKGRQSVVADDNFPEMIKVQGGTFVMGDDTGEKDEKPAREVTVSDFSIAKTETTRAQWRNFCMSTPRRVMPEDPWFVQTEEHPVINVSWDNAVAYCLWLSDVSGKECRLPTEAEWEFAAGGGVKGKGFPYSGSKNPDSVAWYGRKTDGTMPVAQKAPNELGLYDMTGNVWEWTSDWYDPAKREFYVLKGGAWDIGLRNSRIGYRNPLAPMGRNYNKGFRVVCGGME